MKTMAKIGSVVLVATAALLANQVQAEDYGPARVLSTKVSYADLDLRSEKGARIMYERIRNASMRVCPWDGAISLAETSAVNRCRREAVKGAVRSLNAPLVTAQLEGRRTSTQYASR
jgi:UrcA family protein